jgi:hypothetical protein
MSLSPEELKSGIKEVMELLYDIKLDMWLEDYDSAEKKIKVCDRKLAEFVAFGYALRDKLNFAQKQYKEELQGENQKTKSKAELKAELKLKRGHLIRENHYNTDYLFALELENTLNRYKKFIEELDQAEIRSEMAPVSHEPSGFRYKIVPTGPQRYEFRAKGPYTLKKISKEILYTTLNDDTRQLNVTDVSIIDKYPDEGPIRLVNCRVFLSNSVLNLTAFSDTTIAGEIQSPSQDDARKLLESSFVALASTAS